MKFKNDPQDILKPSRAADDRRFGGPELLVGDVSEPVSGVGLDFNNELKRSKCLFLLRARDELDVNVDCLNRKEVGVLDTLS